jgi:DNA-binding phage protein
MRRFRRLKIPEHAHPLVRHLFMAMNHERIGLMDVAERAGIARNTLQGWCAKHNPRVGDLDACFNVLGMELRPVYRRED